MKKRICIGLIAFSLGVAAVIAATIICKHKGLQGTGPAAGGDDPASRGDVAVLAERLNRADSLLKNNPAVQSLRFGVYAASSYYTGHIAWNGETEKDFKHLWDHGFYIGSFLDGVSVLSAGPDGRPDTDMGNVYWLEEHFF